jgi:hypothetical protein
MNPRFSKVKIRFIYIKTLLIVWGLIFFQRGYSQQRTPSQGVYLEIGGNAGFYSVNYERKVYQKGNLRLVTRLGLGVLPQDAFQHYLPIIPVESSALWGKSRHQLEAGIGLTASINTYRKGDYDYIKNSKNNTYYIGNDYKIHSRTNLGYAALLRVGYRYQCRENGLFIRVGFTPSFYRKPVWGLVPCGGVSIGKSF